MGAWFADGSKPDLSRYIGRMLRKAPPGGPFLVDGGADALQHGFTWLEEFARSRRHRSATVLVRPDVNLTDVAKAAGSQGEALIRNHFASVNGIATRLIIVPNAAAPPQPEEQGPVLAVVADTELEALGGLAIQGLCVVPSHQHAVEAWKRRCRPDDGRAYEGWSRYVHNVWARAAKDAVTQVQKEEKGEILPLARRCGPSWRASDSRRCVKSRGPHAT